MGSDERCENCGLSGVLLIGCTDHPNYHDGRYCQECNPWERDRRAELERIKNVARKAWDAARERDYEELPAHRSTDTRIPKSWPRWRTFDAWWCGEFERKEAGERERP